MRAAFPPFFSLPSGAVDNLAAERHRALATREHEEMRKRIVSLRSGTGIPSLNAGGVMTEIAEVPGVVSLSPDQTSNGEVLAAAAFARPPCATGTTTATIIQRRERGTGNKSLTMPFFQSARGG